MNLIVKVLVHGMTQEVGFGQSFVWDWYPDLINRLIKEYACSSGLT